MLKMTVAHSDALDSIEAASEVIASTIDQLGDVTPAAGILAAGIVHDHAAMAQAIVARWPDIELIGGSSDGEFSDGLGYLEDSVSLVAFASDTCEFKAGLARHVNGTNLGSIPAAVHLATAAMETPARLCYTMTSALTASVSDIVDELQAAVGDEVPVVGGATSDDWRFEHTIQLRGTEVVRDGVPFLLIGGDLLVGTGVRSGWLPLGHRATVTRARGNVVYTIDDVPAAAYYRQYLGRSDLQNPAEYPLALHVEPELGSEPTPLPSVASATVQLASTAGEVGGATLLLDEPADAPDMGARPSFTLRAPASIDDENGTVTFFGNVPQGSEVQLTHTTRSSIIDATSDAITQAEAAYPGTEPSGMLCISCTARKVVLGTRVTDEIETLQRRLPDLPLHGFYGYAELVPLGPGEPSRFHNETFVTVILGER